MKERPQSIWFSIAGWGLGISALLPLVLIAGLCFVAPVEWRAKLIGILILACVSALLTYSSCWCFGRRDRETG
jgi:hypothetical protein